MFVFAHRKDFFDLENCSRTFYIHICPSGKVLLLATWLTDGVKVAEQKGVLAAEAVAPCA